VGNHNHLSNRAGIEASEILRCSARYRNQTPGSDRGNPKKQTPERKIEPPEKLRVPLMLQIVKYRYRGSAEKPGTGKTRIEQNVDPVPLQEAKKYGLLPDDSKGPESRPYITSDRVDIRRFAAEVFVRGFAVQVDKVMIPRIHAGQGVHETSQVDLRAPHLARNQVQGINADPE
jgi:hypothetical protein